MIVKALKSESFSLGLAMFSMFFGAGNVIFPLAIGQFAGDKNLLAIAGLIITAAIMPVAGVIAMILFDGNYKAFFGRLGKVPGFLIALTIISLLGPFGSTPRCIALSYTTLKASLPTLSPVLFSGISCLLVFILSVKKNKILSLLGCLLTPLLLFSLLAIIFLGLMAEPTMQAVEYSHTDVFLHGLKEGYNTMDLLAAFFFSSTILNILRSRAQKAGSTSKEYINVALRASLVGATLLAAIYVGFSYLAAFHAGPLSVVSKDELLGAITFRIAGPYAGLLVCVAVALACLTTAIALISSFSDFIQKEVFHERVKYEVVLFWSLVTTFFISTLEFQGISAFLGPLLEALYPGLIVLTFLNIAYRWKAFTPIKIPVFATFALTIGSYAF